MLIQSPVSILLLMLILIILDFESVSASNSDSDSNSNANSNSNSNANAGVNELLFFRNNSGHWCEMIIQHHTKHNVALFTVADICDGAKDFLHFVNIVSPQFGQWVSESLNLCYSSIVEPFISLKRCAINFYNKK